MDKISKRARRAAELQNKCNKQIEMHGHCNITDMLELMELVDAMTPEECDQFLKLLGND
jgi:hypothetical protein